MRQRTLILILALLLAAPSALFAQTTTARLTWDQPLATGQTFTDVQAFQATLKIGTAAATVATMTCVNGTPIKCSVPVPFPLGATSATITLTNPIGSASATYTGAAPSAPINVTVTVTVSVP